MATETKIESQRTGVGTLISLAAQTEFEKDLYNDDSYFEHKRSYDKHTPFYQSHKLLTSKQTPLFGSTFEVEIPTDDGDMIGDVFLMITLPDVSMYNVVYKNNLALHLVNQVKLVLDKTQVLQEFSSSYLDLWSKLEIPSSKEDAYNEMMGKFNTDLTLNGKERNLMIYLPFWWAEEKKPYLPTRASSLTKITIEIEFNTLNSIVQGTNTLNSIVQGADMFKSENVKLVVTPISILLKVENMVPEDLPLVASVDFSFIHLSTEESYGFLQTDHDILYQFVNVQNELITKDIQKINSYFSYPVKYLLLVLQDPKDKFNYKPIKNFRILLQSHSLITHKSEFFKFCHFYNHAKAIPDENIYMYSFALDISASQPSGALNIGQVSSFVLEVEGGIGLELQIFGVGYNILRVSGKTASIKFQ
jgi:hypothetical protein